ncbi:MAG: hypothetical protein R3E53_15935 [Myxococcota bacterium]
MVHQVEAQAASLSMIVHGGPFERFLAAALLVHGGGLRLAPLLHRIDEHRTRAEPS